MRNTIRWRIGIPFAILLVISVLGLGYYFNSLVQQTYVHDIEEHLTISADKLAEDCAPYLGGEPDIETLTTLAHQYAEILGARVTIIQADGVVLADSEADVTTMDNHLSRPEVKGAMSGTEASETRFSATVGENLMYIAVPIESNHQIIGAARLAVSLSEVERIPLEIRQTITTLMLILVLLAVIIAVIVTEVTVRPLRSLTQAVNSMSRGEFDSHLLPASRDEIGELSQAFSQMAEALQNQFEALKKERGRLVSVMGHMTDGVVMVNADGIVELINPAAARMFQVPEDTALGRSMAEVLRHHQIVSLWEACKKSGEQQATTLEIPMEKIYLQCIVIPMAPSLPDSTLLLLQDLTQVRKLETVRQDFVSNVSHELRTPLAALKALTETLQEGALEDPPAAQRFLSRMDSELDNLSQMVQELLELSHIESGKVQLNRKSVSPLTILSQAVDRMHLQAERAGVSLDLQCPDDIPQVHVDAGQVEHVLLNLLHNAIKFTPAGGEITASAERTGNMVMFMIRDTGVGIPDSDLPRIFERFFKTDRARSSGGTGLGLSIARHIVEGHGGRIWAESRINQGSTFFFTMPIYRG